MKTYIDYIGNNKLMARGILELYNAFAGSGYTDRINAYLRSNGVTLEKHHLNRLINDLEAGNRVRCESKAFFAQIILTTDCNLECIMCGRVRGQSGTLDLKAFKNIESFLPYISCISWQGGEVFVVDYFFELLSRITRKYPHIEHKITTNGLLLDEKTSVLLAENNVDIMFSIDSLEKSNYESIRKKGNFEKLLKNLDFIGKEYDKRNNVKFCLNTVVMKRNMDELVRFPDFCGKYRIGAFNFGYLISDGIKEEDIFADNDRELIERLTRNVGEAKTKFAALGIKSAGDLETYLGSYSGAVPMAAVPTDGEHAPKCLRPWQSVNINWDGRVFPSCECRESAGNVYSNRLEEIWNSKAIEIYRESVIAGKRPGVCSERCIKGPIPLEYESGYRKLVEIAAY